MNRLDEYFIKETFELAKRGEGIVSPNPLVGACVVRDGQVVGRGYHKGPGTPHAEVEAITKAGDKTKSATLYISLEPCCHYGNTPPCVGIIESSGIGRVVSTIKDPNPLVNGKGFKSLKKKGIKVKAGILEKEARELNSFYLKYITTKIPYVILKAALTLDGKIGDPERGIFKISGEQSHMEVHRLRSRVDALLIGVGTLLSDDPRLTVRGVEVERQPYKIILDPNLKTPLDARIFKGGGKVIIASTDKKAKEKYPDAIVWLFKEKKRLIDVKDILKRAGREKITSVMVEGGSETFTHFVEKDVVDRYLIFISPSFIGKGIPFLNSQVERFSFNAEVKRMGEDILIEAANVYGNN